MFAQTQPVPRDIPLPLPLPEWLLIFLLILSFLLHILFVNLMLGGTLLTFVLQIMGLKEKKYDKLAREIEVTITVNKSLAVVIGVAPLLIINTLYTVYFYSANALTGYAWISIVPLVIIAFLVLYYHKYKWDKFENKKVKHIVILGVALAVLLFVPLIFLSNISLMLFPERWADVRGFFSSLLIENVIPRYLHFLTGTVAITGLFIFGYFGRKSYPLKEKLPDFTKDEIKEKAYKLTLYATLSQLVFGPLLFFTLPWHGVDWNLAYIIIAGILIATVAMVLLWLDLKGKKLGRSFGIIVILLSITVLMMGWARQTYRANTIDPHRKLMQEHR